MRQREAFLSGGAPPDFPDLGLERGSPRRAPASRLSRLGRQQMGFDPFQEPDWEVRPPGRYSLINCVHS